MTRLYLRITIAGHSVEARIESWRQAPVSAVGPIASTEEDRDDEIRALHQAGLSTRAIGAQVGLHHSTVARILQSRGGSDA